MVKRRSIDRTVTQTYDDLVRETSENQRDQKIKLANFAKALHDKSTRELVWEILGFTGLYNVNTACDNTVFMTEGSRKVGLQILDLLFEIDPGIYTKMILEHKPQQDDGEEDNG